MAPEVGQHRAAPPPEARRAVGRGSLTQTRSATAMTTIVEAAEHARGLYMRTLHTALRPLRSAEADVHYLHAVEQKGEAAETPVIAMLGLFLVLSSVFLVMLSLAFAAYYLA